MVNNTLSIESLGSLYARSSPPAWHSSCRELATANLARYQTLRCQLLPTWPDTKDASSMPSCAAVYISNDHYQISAFPFPLDRKLLGNGKQLRLFIDVDARRGFLSIRIKLANCNDWKHAEVKYKKFPQLQPSAITAAATQFIVRPLHPWSCC